MARPFIAASSDIMTAREVSRRSLLRSAAGAVGASLAGGRAAVSVADSGAADWQPRWILASALYGPFPLADILPEGATTGATMIDLWPKPHGTQREEVDALGMEKVREMFAAAGVTLGGIACYMKGPFNLAGEFALAKKLGAESPVLVTLAPGKGDAPAADLAAAIEAFLEKLRPSIAAAEEAGGVIAIENHSNSLLQTPDGIRRFADAVTSDRVGVALAPLDFGPLMRQLAAMNFAGPVEIFMHPVPRGVPILDTVAAITAEVNRARTALLAGLGKNG